MLLPVVIAAGAVLVMAHVAPFRFLLDAMHRDAAVWRMPVSGAGKPIYLTFDDGPNPTATPELLSLLDEKNIKATFFVIDEYVTEETSPIVRRMFAEGHCVGQHTGRRWLSLRSPAHIADMLLAGAQKIERLTGHAPSRHFRPHAGWRSETMFRGAARAGYTIVGWSWMSWDWVGFRKRTSARVARQVVRHAAPGKIVVIHDGHHRNARADRTYAVEATRRIIDELRTAGYTFHTLCQSVAPDRQISAPQRPKVRITNDEGDCQRPDTRSDRLRRGIDGIALLPGAAIDENVRRVSMPTHSLELARLVKSIVANAGTTC